MHDTAELPILRFQDFQLDLSNCELRKGNRRLRLQRQPFRVLLLLATNAGRVVSREEIQQEVWGGHTFVDFEQGLNFCVKQIRAALGDNPRSPRYVETLARQGYRLLVPVQGTPASFDFARKRFALKERSPLQRLIVEVASLKNLGREMEGEHFAASLTDSILARLVELQELVVLGSEGRRDNEERSAPDLRVEGSVSQHGQRVRIVVRLVEAKHRRHLWAETYERSTANPHAVLDEISWGITTEIRNRFCTAGRSVLERLPSVEAQVSYLRGRFYWNKRTPAAIEKAIDLFRDALRRDSTYAPAYAGIADCHAVLGGYDLIRPAACFTKAKEAALKALDLDPTLAEAHTSLGFVRFFYDWDWGGAEREFRRAIELEPNHANAHHWLTLCLAATGRIGEARAEIERARQLDPLSLIIEETVGWISHFARQYDQAIEEYRKTLDMDPNFLPAYEGLGLACEQNHMWKEAIEAFQKAVTLSEGSSRNLAALGHAFAVSGRTRKARTILQDLERLAVRNYVSSYDVALIHAGLSDVEQSLDWLERAVAERAAGIVWLKVEPRLDVLRLQERYRMLASTVGADVPAVQLSSA